MKIQDGQYCYELENVHISRIRVGDTILDQNGLLKTVCRNNITRDPFVGLCLFGDPYRLGTLPVKRVKFVLKD